MSKRKSTNISTILSSFVILLVVVMAVGFLFVSTNEFTTEPKLFYVKYKDEMIFDNRENFDIVLNEEYEFEVVTNFDIDGNSKYSVSIIPNEKYDLVYQNSTDGTQHLKDLKSLAKGFSIVGNENSFTLKANLDLPEILMLYDDTIITNVGSVIDTNIPYFKLVVASADATEIININFNLKSE